MTPIDVDSRCFTYIARMSFLRFKLRKCYILDKSLYRLTISPALSFDTIYHRLYSELPHWIPILGNYKTGSSGGFI